MQLVRISQFVNFALTLCFECAVFVDIVVPAYTRIFAPIRLLFHRQVRCFSEMYFKIANKEKKNSQEFSVLLILLSVNSKPMRTVIGGICRSDI